MENIFFPILDREKRLPFYVTCIGENNRQHEINRPEGYYCTQIILCSKGEGVLNFNGEEHIITSGKAFFLPANNPHSYRPTGKIWYTHYVSFSGYASELFLRQLGLTNIGVYEVDADIMGSLFRKMMNTLKTDKFYGGFSASAILYEYILEFNRQITAARSRSAHEGASLTPVLNFVDTHYSEAIELETLCGIIGVSPQYLCRLFQKRLGTRPLEYIAQRRIQQAKVYLTEGKMSIKEIALKVGYSDASYFSSVFKRIEGISPKKYAYKESYNF